MGKQALDILSAKLAASGKFLLLERSDLAQLLEEAKKSENGESGLQSIGADYLIIGSITEFGRKNTGKEGVFTSTKMQTVEAGVAIRLVDVSTGLIVYSDEAKGQAQITTRSTLGVGGRADFDATLSDKAISGRWWTCRLRRYAERQGHLGGYRSARGEHYQQVYRQALAHLLLDL